MAIKNMIKRNVVNLDNMKSDGKDHNEFSKKSEGC
jgi:hypothetical protein